SLAVPPPQLVAGSGKTASQEVPVYDRKRGELRYKGKLVRKVRRSAKNLVRILVEFEEFNWPESIEDPLPGPADGREARLHNALQRLNKHQQKVKTLFSRRGSTIFWEVKE